MNEERDMDFIHLLYNKFFRPHLPNKISVHNGVAVEDVIRLFDITDRFPEHEAALVSAIRERTKQGDDVTLVGGGIGVSTVAAAEATGREGTITMYEASSTQYDVVKNTVELNKVEDIVNPKHAVVGSLSEYSLEAYGGAGDADLVDSTSLPACDVLVLDCEGAEVEILRHLEDTPRAIIVETHGFLDAPEELIRDILDEMGYEVVDRGVELQTKDIFVLTATSK
jgi:tRNA A58 N-methylase Trm61